MSETGGLFHRLTDHVEMFLVFASLCGIIAASYRIWVPQATIARQHQALSRAFERLSRGSWLDLMKSGVERLLKLLTRLYGPPHAGEPGNAARFLTVAAWKTSAWIAAYLLLGLPPLAMAIALPVTESRRGASVPWEASAVFVGMWLFVTVVFVATYRFSGPARFTWRLDTVGGDFIRDSGRIVALIAAPALAFGAIGVYLEQGAAAIASGVLALAFGLGGFLFIFAQAIRKYGFIAPLAFAAQLTVVGILLSNLGMAAGAVFAQFASTEDEWAMALLLGGGAAFLIYRCFQNLDDNDELIVIFVGLVLLDLAFLYLADDTHGSNNLSAMATGFAGAMMGIVLPYTLALYAAVYSNSLPDWVSIALTRHFLAKAAAAGSLRLFLALLLADMALASACVIATFLIIVITFTVCGILVSLSTSLVDLGPYYGSVATFFFGGFKAAPMLAELMGGTPIRMIASPGPASAGGITALVLVAISSTSLIPSLVNALTLVVLLLGRIAGLVVARPAEILHKTLLTPDGADQDEARRSFLRSSILIGIGFGALIYLVLLPIYWLLS